MNSCVAFLFCSELRSDAQCLAFLNYLSEILLHFCTRWNEALWTHEELLKFLPLESHCTGFQQRHLFLAALSNSPCWFGPSQFSLYHSQRHDITTSLQKVNYASFLLFKCNIEEKINKHILPVILSNQEFHKPVKSASHTVQTILLYIWSSLKNHLPNKDAYDNQIYIII